MPAIARSVIFATRMLGPIRYIIAGFLGLVIVFAAFSPHIALMYEKSVNKEDIALAADAGTEKKTCEVKELLPEEVFVDTSGFLLLQPAISFIKTFAAFRQPYMHMRYDRIPTPPPRVTA